MILDSLDQAGTYHGLGPRFGAAFDYIKNFHQEIPDGRHDVDGDNLFALVQSFETEPREKRTFESHQRYADIHYIVSGNEVIYYRLALQLNPRTEYDSGKDVVFYHDEDDYPIYLDTGSFVVFWPQDGHKPGCIWSVPMSTRKVVMKIRL